MGYVRQDEWNHHYAEGKGFRQLGDAERDLLAEHVPAPHGGRALDVGCGLGELAVFLRSVGYTVDAVDYADSALSRAGADCPGDVRLLHLDIERDDLDDLSNDGYDLITFRLAYPFLRDRTRVMHDLGLRLRRGGAVVVITPLADAVSEDKRDIALDESEIGLLSAGWGRVLRLGADGMAVLVLRGPCHTDTEPVKKHSPSSHAQTGALADVTDDSGGVLPGALHHRHVGAARWQDHRGRVVRGGGRPRTA